MGDAGEMGKIGHLYCHRSLPELPCNAKEEEGKCSNRFHA